MIRAINSGPSEEANRLAQEWQIRKRFIKFEVSDTGMGIPEEKLPFIFTLFEQDVETYQLDAQY